MLAAETWTLTDAWDAPFCHLVYKINCWQTSHSIKRNLQMKRNRNIWVSNHLQLSDALIKKVPLLLLSQMFYKRAEFFQIVNI